MLVLTCSEAGAVASTFSSPDLDFFELLFRSYSFFDWGLTDFLIEIGRSSRSFSMSSSIWLEDFLVLTLFIDLDDFLEIAFPSLVDFFDEIFIFFFGREIID